MDDEMQQERDISGHSTDCPPARQEAAGWLRCGTAGLRRERLALGPQRNLPACYGPLPP